MTRLRFTPLKRSEINRLRSSNTKKNDISCDYSTIFKQGDLYYYLDADGKPHGPFQTIDETELVIDRSSSK